MKTKIDIWKWLLPIWLLATSCIYDDLDCPETNKDDASSHPYVVLRIAVPSDGTRSNPTGGEEGDGREAGIGNEEKIHDINVFFYNHKDGLDAPDDTSVFFRLYYNRENADDSNNTELEDFSADEDNDGVGLNSSGKYLELHFRVPSEYKTKLVEGVQFAAVANVGCIDGVNTIGDLTGLDLSGRINGKASLSNRADEMDYFPMSTAYNKEYKDENGRSTGDNRIRLLTDHLEGVTTIERLYARIDLWYKADRLGDNKNCLSYEVLDGKDDTDTGNKVYVYNVLPVNVMQTPSYLFKKVTDTPADTPEDGDIIWDKKYLSALEDFKWGGKETPSGIPTSSPNDLPTNYVMERHTLHKSPGGTTGDLPEWYGTTEAKQVRSDITDPGKGKLSGYHSPEKQFVGNGCDHVFIISYANENTHPVDCFHSNYLTGLAFRCFYKPAAIYSNANLTETTGNSMSAGGKIYRYSPSTSSDGKIPSEKYSRYFSNKAAADAYRDSHSSEYGEITEFDAESKDGLGIGFTCYYNLWLRHYNDKNANPQQTYPMEYATVRNNIYRVSIGFTGPGDPDPEMREPDTMMSRIFVRKWNLRVESSPLQF